MRIDLIRNQVKNRQANLRWKAHLKSKQSKRLTFKSKLRSSWKLVVRVPRFLKNYSNECWWFGDDFKTNQRRDWNGLGRQSWIRAMKSWISVFERRNWRNHKTVWSWRKSILHALKHCKLWRLSKTSMMIKTDRCHRKIKR